MSRSQADVGSKINPTFRSRSTYGSRNRKKDRITRKKPPSNQNLNIDLDSRLSQSVDMVGSQKDSIHKVDMSIQNAKDLFLFPSPKSQGTKLTNASVREGVDLENSDIERYINKEINASLSESIDLA